MRNWIKVLWFLAILPCRLLAQSEAESSEPYLRIEKNHEHPKTMHVVNVGEHVKLKIEGQEKAVKGKLVEIQDTTSIVVGEQTVALDQVTQLNARPEGSTIFQGIIMLFIAGGLGFVAWLLGRAMLTNRLDKWWQWVLVALAAVFVIILLPLALVAALVLWALSQHHYQIGKSYVLKVGLRKSGPKP